jgi:hypothetical protein
MPEKLLEYITDMPRVVGGIDEESPSPRLRTGVTNEHEEKIN